MSKNNKDPINPEDIKAWEDFKGKKFLEGDKGEIFKKPIKENKKQDQIDFKIDLHGYSLQESFVKIRSVIENCYQKDLRNILIIKKILFYNLFFNLNKKAPDPPKL